MFAAGRPVWGTEGALFRSAHPELYVPTRHLGEVSLGQVDGSVAEKEVPMSSGVSLRQDRGDHWDA